MSTGVVCVAIRRLLRDPLLQKFCLHTGRAHWGSGAFSMPAAPSRWSSRALERSAILMNDSPEDTRVTPELLDAAQRATVLEREGKFFEAELIYRQLNNLKPVFPEGKFQYLYGIIVLT